MTLPEFGQGFELRELPGLKRQVGCADRDFFLITERKQRRRPSLFGVNARFLVFPFGAGHRRTAIGAAVVAHSRSLRQGRTEARPQN